MMSRRIVIAPLGTFGTPLAAPLPQKHAELIKQWADGAEIQVLKSNGGFTKKWTTVKFPTWSPDQEFRVKPKPDIVKYLVVSPYAGCFGSLTDQKNYASNLKLTYCGTTGALKSAQVV